MLNIELRQMRIKDITIVLSIEKQLFSSPWQKDMFLQEIKTGHAFVAIEKTKNTIAGYICGMMLYDEFNITNLAVCKAFQRQGLAETMVKFIIGQLIRHRCYKFFLEVRESNLPALAFYRKLGFSIIGKRNKYYNHPSEDALMMQLDLLDQVNMKSKLESS